MATATAQLEIPRDILDSARLSLEELRVEIAVHLFARGRLGIGKAHELAGLSLWEFRQLLGSRRIAPHYDLDDLKDDVTTVSHRTEAGDGHGLAPRSRLRRG